MQNVYKNIEKYNIGKYRKILIIFYDIIADMIHNKKLNPINCLSETEVFLPSDNP